MDTVEMIDVTNPAALLACPHCGAGMDGVVLGLFWDSREDAWRCVLCGHRSFEQKRQTDAQLQEDRLWDKILAIYDRAEESSPEDQGDWQENVINI
jgi:DNA-directed RNA polymerase subunit RPC12/RpoP